MKMNSVVHFEMPASDKKRMIEFYSKVFGWQTMITGPEMGEYVVVTTTETDGPGGRPKTPGAINGGFFQKDPSKGHDVTSLVIAVDDIHEHIKKLKDAGAKILGEPVNIAGIGDYVSFEDPDGNKMSILQPAPMMSK